MPTYRYVGRGSDGRQVSGQLEANSEELAAESLMGKGSSLLRLNSAKVVSLYWRWMSLVYSRLMFRLRFWCFSAVNCIA